MCSLSWQDPVQLGDLAVDERTQSFFQFNVVSLQLSVVLFLIWSNQGLILPQGILTPAWKRAQTTQRAAVCFLLDAQQSVSESRSVSSPFSEVFKAEAQFVVMAKQLWIIRNVGKKYLCHLKGAL